MKKKASTLANMVLSLTLVSAIAGLCLGAVYNITKEPIAIAKKEKQEQAIKAVLPEFDRIEVEDKKVDGDVITFNRAYLNDELVGTAINTFTKKGFSGEIRLMVGLLPDNTINDINVLSHQETPGLGDKMDIKKSKFPIQFQGKNPETFILKVTKDGGNVDAITSATISSRAYCDAVQRAVDANKN